MIATPIQRIYKPDVSRLISALKKIDPNRADAKEKFDDIAACVIGQERATEAPFVCERKDFVVTTNVELYEALCKAKSGQVIFIPDETIIDMADFLLLYPGGVQALPIVKKGVTLMGERGVAGSRGAIIRAQCMAQPLLAIEEGGRISGLAIGGHDGEIEEKILVEHQSVGIRIDGDNVCIDNCEIAGFARCALQVNGFSNITVENCYIHDVFGVDAGFAIEGENATLSLVSNTFSRVRSVCGGAGVVMTETGSQHIKFPILSNPADYHLPLVCADATNDDAGYQLLKKILSSDVISSQDLKDAISLIGNLSNFEAYSYSVELNDLHFGPRNEFEPIGGGKGYLKIYTDGDFVVRNGKEFLSALDTCKDGDVIYIPGDCVIDIAEEDVDFSRKNRLAINKSITIASNRGQILPDGSVSHGGVLYWPNYKPFHYCYVTAPDFRLSGLIFKGPDNHSHVLHHRLSLYKEDENGKLVRKTREESYYYDLWMGRGFFFMADGAEVENCEACGMNFAAFCFGLNRDNTDGSGKRRSEGNKVHHCYLHHNQLDGLGYGVTVDMASVEFYANVLNYNRHSIASCGVPEVEYMAHDNVEMGNSLCHYFDIHGGHDRRDGTNIAGEYCEIKYNAFLGPENPYCMRGRPVIAQHVDNNIIFRSRPAYKRMLTHDDYGRGERVDNLYIGKNVWNYAENPTVLTGGNGDQE